MPGTMRHPHRHIRNQRPMRTSQSAAKGTPEGRADIPSKRQTTARRSQPHPTLPGTVSLTEGDLHVGKDGGSAIGTLVERTTRYVMLLHLPHHHGALAVQEAMVTAMADLPETLRRTLTWDQGSEMANHAQIAVVTGLDIYFCDPHSPRQRGTNENTATPVLPQGHRPVRPRPRHPRERRLRAEPATPTDPRLGHPRRSPRHATVQPVSTTPCCVNRLKPPSFLGHQVVVDVDDPVGLSGTVRDPSQR